MTAPLLSSFWMKQPAKVTFQNESYRLSSNIMSTKLDKLKKCDYRYLHESYLVELFCGAVN